MVTTNLGIIEPTEAQEQKTVTISNALEKLDGATQGPTALTITGNTTVTADEFTEGFSLELTGTPGSPFDLTVPNTRRFFRVLNSTDAIATVKAPSAGDTIDIPIGEARLLYGNADNDIFEEGGGGGGGGDIAIEDEGSEVLAAATRLDFKGAGVDAVDDGSGQAGITIPGVETQEGGTPIVTGTVAINFNSANFNVTDETGGVTGVDLVDNSLETKVNRITTDQNITGSPEQIQWNNEVLDEFAGHDNSTNNERIVIGTNVVDVQAQVGLLNVAGNAVTTARVVRYNSADALQEVHAAMEAEEDRLINLAALNVRGQASGDYLVIDLASTDSNIDVDRTTSFFLVRRSSGGGGGGASSIDELSDVDMTAEAPVAGDHMIFNGSNWVPVPRTSYCRVLNTGVSISDNTNTLISFTVTDEVDKDNYHDPGSNPSRVIAPFNGEYEWILDVGFGNYNSTTFIQTCLNLNRAGSTTFNALDVPGSFLENTVVGTGSGRYKVMGSGIILLTATDYLELIIQQISGAARDTRNIRLTLRYLGP